MPSCWQVILHLGLKKNILKQNIRKFQGYEHHHFAEINIVYGGIDQNRVQKNILERILVERQERCGTELTRAQSALRSHDTRRGAGPGKAQNTRLWDHIGPSGCGAACGGGQRMRSAGRGGP